MHDLAQNSYRTIVVQVIALTTNASKAEGAVYRVDSGSSGLGGQNSGRKIRFKVSSQSYIGLHLKNKS